VTAESSEVHDDPELQVVGRGSSVAGEQRGELLDGRGASV
jgi:hypothetical protein